MEADFVELLQQALGANSDDDGEADGLEPRVTSAPFVNVSSSSNSATFVPESPVATPATDRRSRVRKRKSKVKPLGGDDKKRIYSVLESTDNPAFFLAVSSTVSAERHMTVFPARLASFVAHQDLWRALVLDLLGGYRGLYRQCSTRADKYAVFQVKWAGAVRSCFDRADILATGLNEDDRTCVVVAVGAAVWLQCCRIIKKEIGGEPEHGSDNEGVKPTDTHVHRFFGWALSSCIKVQSNKVSSFSSSERTGDSEMELALLRSLCVDMALKEDANIPASLSIRDRGFMRFIKDEHMEFARVSMEKILSVVNADAYATYGKDLVKVAAVCMEHDQALPDLLMDSVLKVHGPDAFSRNVVHGVAGKLLQKVQNAVCDEVIDSTEQIQLLDAGGTSTSGLNLRDRLHLSKA